MPAEIRYLRREQIDTGKWDACIARSVEGLIYQYSFYLDAIAENWGGIVVEDYEAILPFTWKTKFGIRYVHQAPFVQRLPVCGARLSRENVFSIFQTLAHHFPLVDFNTGSPEVLRGFHLTQRTNLVIPLHQPYEQIRMGYSRECTDNLRKASERHCGPIEKIGYEQVIEIYQATYGHLQQDLDEGSFQRLRMLCEAALSRDQVSPCGIKDLRTGELIFGALVFHCNKRHYYLVAAPTETGRKARVTYWFIDQFLRLNSGTPFLFDFEGSELPRVAAFYNRFGPQKEFYSHIRKIQPLNMINPFRNGWF